MFIFPVHLFNPGTIKASPRPRVIEGGTSLTGDSDAISADGGGRWYIEYGDINLRTPEMERWWRQWESYLAGGSRIAAVPTVTLRTAPRPSAGGCVMKVSELYADDTVFPTVTRFAAPYIVATVVNAVAVGATQMTINVAQGARIRGGETFSVGARAYTIERILSVSGQVATFVTSPPARYIIPANSPANFEWPIVQAKMTIGQDLGIPFSMGYGTASISFVEDFSVV